MTSEAIQNALVQVREETDPTVKHLMLASLCAALFSEKGIELTVVGGSAIEFYTEGAYTSGDVDMCVSQAKTPLTIRLRQEIMGRLGAKGRPRSWEIGKINSCAHFQMSHSLRLCLCAKNISPLTEQVRTRLAIAQRQEVRSSIRLRRSLLQHRSRGGAIAGSRLETRRTLPSPRAVFTTSNLWTYLGTGEATELIRHLEFTKQNHKNLSLISRFSRS